MGLVKNKTIKQQITIILVLALIGPTIAVVMNVLFAQRIDDRVVADMREEMGAKLAGLSEQLKANGLHTPENLADREAVKEKFKQMVRPLLEQNSQLKIGYNVYDGGFNMHAWMDPENREDVVVVFTQEELPPHLLSIMWSGRSPSPDHPFAIRSGRSLSPGHPSIIPPVRRRDLMRAYLPVTNNDQVVGRVWIEDRVVSDLSAFLFVKYSSLVIIIISLCVGVLGITLIIRNLLAQIDSINSGIGKLQEDLDYKLPSVPGELDMVTATVNQMARELREKRDLEMQLQRSERLAAIGHFVSGIAHELRNPLGIMRATAQLMEEELQDGAAVKEYTGIVKEQADRQNRIIQELLDFAKPSPPQLGSVDLNKLLDGVLTFTRAYLKEGGISLGINKQQDLPEVFADGEKLKQVIINLILNGAQAMPGGGHLEISTRAAEDNVVMEFADTGEGIPSENLEKIFNPFFTTRDTGTGLGLAISHQIIKMHGGTIDVKSSEGKGSVFTVTMPILSAGSDINV